MSIRSFSLLFLPKRLVTLLKNDPVPLPCCFPRLANAILSSNDNNLEVGRGGIVLERLELVNLDTGFEILIDDGGMDDDDDGMEVEFELSCFEFEVILGNIGVSSSVVVKKKIKK